MCGEKFRYVMQGIVQGKSPPRVRGKVIQPQVFRQPQGITPACAGKRVAAHCSKFMPKDHPRVCGEKQIFAYARNGMLGSPPRVRGKEWFLLA